MTRDLQMSFAIVRDLLLHRIELFFVMYIFFSGLYKVLTASLFIAIPGDQLDVVMVVGSITHGAQIYALTLIDFLNNVHEAFGITDDLFIDRIGRFAHVMIVFYR